MVLCPRRYNKSINSYNTNLINGNIEKVLELKKLGYKWVGSKEDFDMKIKRIPEGKNVVPFIMEILDNDFLDQNYDEDFCLDKFKFYIGGGKDGLVINCEITDKKMKKIVKAYKECNSDSPREIHLSKRDNLYRFCVFSLQEHECLLVHKELLNREETILFLESICDSQVTTC